VLRGTIAEVSAADLELVTTIRRALAEAADPLSAGPMQAYMKSEMPYRGIPSPQLKALLRPLLEHRPLDDKTWHDTVLALWDTAAFREERYAALAIARHRLHREHRQAHTIGLYEHLVRTGAWWDLVDGTSHLVGEILVAHPAEVGPVIREWAVADDLWVRRSAIICQVGTRGACDQVLLAEAIETNLDGSTRNTPARSPYGREFFIRKGIGWALRDHARSDADWVRAFVGRHADGLSGLSRREALKHLQP
jgi:3-methyladenine DNA glycosylase AlkD